MPSAFIVRLLRGRLTSSSGLLRQQDNYGSASGLLSLRGSVFRIPHACASGGKDPYHPYSHKVVKEHEEAWEKMDHTAAPKIDMRRANYDEMATPDGPWQAYYDLRQRRYNLVLGLGLVSITAVGIFIWQTDPFQFEKALKPRKFMKNPPVIHVPRQVNGKIYAYGEPVPEDELNQPPPPPPASSSSKSDKKADKKADSKAEKKSRQSKASSDNMQQQPERKGSSIANAAASALGVNQLTSANTTSSSSSDVENGDAEKNPLIAEPNREHLPDIPSYAPYVIIGGGTASFAAFRAIRARDPAAKVLVISNEKYLPYMRPPLSKEVWFTDDSKLKQLKFTRWNGRDRSLLFEQSEFYVDPKTLPFEENGGVAIALGRNAVQVDAVQQKVMLDNGWEVQYDKLLIATGGRPRSLPVFERAGPEVMQNVTLYRGIDDYNRLSEIVPDAKRIVIVGSGFLGSELACSLGRLSRTNERPEILQIYREAGNMAHVLPAYLSSWTTKRVESEGAKVLPNTTISSVKLLKAAAADDDDENEAPKRQQLRLTLNDGSTIDADHVVVAVGIEPEAQLAHSSGLEIDPEIGGYRTNAELQARNNIWVAGDCSSFYDVRLGRRRVEHHDHAVVSGRLAGENMAGGAKPYYHQSMFWSDLGPDLGYEAIGLVDSRLETFGVFARATSKDSPKALVEATGESLRSVTETETTSSGNVAEKKAVSAEGSSWASLLKSAAEEPSTDNATVDNDDEKGNVTMLSSESSNDEDEDEPKTPRIESLLPDDFTDGKLDYGKGIIFYLRNQIIVGMVMWNVFNRMPMARKILKDERNVNEISEVAKLFQIHKDEVDY